jgi:hypothetical protein
MIGTPLSASASPHSGQAPSHLTVSPMNPHDQSNIPAAARRQSAFPAFSM